MKICLILKKGHPSSPELPAQWHTFYLEVGPSLEGLLKSGWDIVGAAEVEAEGRKGGER